VANLNATATAVEGQLIQLVVSYLLVQEKPVARPINAPLPPLLPLPAICYEAGKMATIKLAN